MSSKNIRLIGVGNVSSEELQSLTEKRINEDIGKENKSTMQDYWQSTNPITIGLFHPELAMQYSDIYDPTPISMDDIDIKNAFKDLDQENINNILSNSSSKIQAIKQAERAKIQKESDFKTSKDTGIEQFMYGIIPAITTPASLVTLPIGGGLAKGILTTGLKQFSTATALGAISFAADAEISNLVGEKKDIVDEAITGAIVGGAFGAIGAGFAMRSKKLEQNFAKYTEESNKFDDTFEVHINEDGTQVLKLVDETIDEVEIQPYPKESIEYIDALNKHNEAFDREMFNYNKSIEDIDFDSLDVVGKAEFEVKSINDQIELIKKEHVAPEVPNKYTKNVLEDTEVPFKDTEILSRAKKETKGTIEELTVKQSEALKVLKDSLTTTKEKLKAMPKLAVKARSGVQKNIDSILQSIETTKVSHKRAIEDIIIGHKAKLPLTYTKKISVKKEFEIDPTEYALKVQKESIKELNKKLAPLLETKKVAVENLRLTKLKNKAFAKQEKAQYTEPVYPKFEAPTREVTVKNKTGKKTIEGVISLPKLEKLFGEPDKAAVYYSVVKKLSDIGNAVDGFFGSKLNVLHQSDNLVIRNVANMIDSPTYSIYSNNGIPLTTGETAVIYKRLLNGKKMRLLKNINIIYETAKKEGKVKNIDEFNVLVGNHYKKYVEKNTNEIYEIVRRDLSELSDEAKLSKAADEVDTKLEFGDNKFLEDSVRQYKEYYYTMYNEGLNIKTKGLKPVSINKWFMPITYDKKAISKLDINEVKNIVLEAIEKHPANNKLTHSEKVKLAETTSTSIYSEAIDTFGRVSQIKDVKMNITTLDKLINNDIEKITNVYHYKTIGKYALQKFFNATDTTQIIKTISEDSIKKGISLSKRDIKALTEILKDVDGTLRLEAISSTSPLWRFSRVMQSYNVVRLLGNSGFVQLAELAGTATAMSMHGVLNKSQMKVHLQAASKAMYNSDGTVSPLASFLLDIDMHHSALGAEHSNRYIDLDEGLFMGVAERSASWGASKIMKYNGMASALNFQESVVAAATINIIRRVGTSQARKSDDILLRNFGLTKEDALKIKNDLAKNTSEDLQIFNYHNMEPANLKKLQMASIKNMQNNIVEGNSIHNPSFIKTADPLSRMVFQFLRFPLTATTILLRRGFSEDKAAMFGSMVAQAATYSSIAYLMEEAKVALGLIKPSDRKFDIFNNPQHAENLALKSFTYIAALGLFTVTYDKLAIVTPLKSLGSTEDYKSKTVLDLFGPTASLVSTVYPIALKVLYNEDISAYEHKQLQTTFPAMTFPMFRETYNMIMEDL